jgi:hypothetical protein
MKKNHLRMQMCIRSVSLMLVAISLACVCALPWSDSRAQALPPAIDFHVVSSGGAALHNSCFHLAGTVGQTAPGYSSAATAYSLIAGFWSAAPTTGLDEIFFNGFEGC